MAATDPPPPLFTATGTDAHAASADDRPTAAVVKDVVGGVQSLVRQELELARLELMEGVNAKAQAAGAGGAAGVLGLYVVGFLGLAAGYGLAEVMALWAAFLVVAGVLLLLLVALLLFAKKRATATPVAPEQSIARIKEDVAWAKTLTRR